jgi:hypothetical protein
MTDLRKTLDRTVAIAPSAARASAFRPPEQPPNVEVTLPISPSPPRSFTLLVSGSAESVRDVPAHALSGKPASIPAVTSELPKQVPDPPPERYFASGHPQAASSKEPL